MAEDTGIVEQVKEVSIDTLSLPDYKKARAEGKTTVEQKVAPVEEVEEIATEETEETKPEDKPKHKGGFQKRIDRLVKQNSTLEQELEQLRAKSPKEEKKEVVVAGEPQRDQFESEVAYVKALTRWEVKQEIKEQQEAEQREVEESRQKEIVKNYNDRVSAAQSRYDDWKEVVNQDLEIPQGVGLAILRMENGPDVAYRLGSDSELRDAIMAMDPLEAIGKAWEISREIATKGKSKSVEKDDDEDEEEVKAAKVKEAPIKPVSGGVTKSSIPLDKTDFAAYKKRRAQGQLN